MSLDELRLGPAVSELSMTMTTPKAVLEVLVVAARATGTDFGSGPLTTSCHASTP